MFSLLFSCLMLLSMFLLFMYLLFMFLLRLFTPDVVVELNVHSCYCVV